jgi:hypothetical protein
VHKRIVSTVKGVVFISDRMPYMILKVCWYDIIVLNVNVPTQDKIHAAKDSFYEELECVCGKFP